MEVKKFDMNTIKPGKVILMVGKRNTGKSTLIVDVLHHLKNQIPCAVCVSGSEDGNGFYKQYMPDIMIYNEYDPNIIQRTVMRQKKITKRKTSGEKVNPHCLILLDDCAFDKSIFRSKEMRYIVYNGRHINITLVIAVQYLVDIPADIRTNIDLVFGLRENIVTNKERLYKFFYGIFPDFHSFCQCFTACTNNFECLVCDNTSRSNEISECVSWYKAPLHSVFRFGHPFYWKLAEKHYNRNYEDDELDNMFEVKKTYSARKPPIPIKKLE